MEGFRSDFDILIREPRGRRWEDNLITDPKEIRVNSRNLIDSAWDTDYQRVLVKRN